MWRIKRRIVYKIDFYSISGLLIMYQSCIFPLCRQNGSKFFYSVCLCRMGVECEKISVLCIPFRNEWADSMYNVPVDWLILWVYIYLQRSVDRNKWWQYTFTSPHSKLLLIILCLWSFFFFLFLFTKNK